VVSKSGLEVGDGNLPNFYWVSISEDYYYMVEPATYDWASDHIKGFKPKGKTLAVFPTYAEAKNFFDEIYIGMDYDGIKVHTKTIEDRLSGQIANEIYHFHPEEPDSGFSDVHEDYGFTKEQMEERGAVFE